MRHVDLHISAMFVHMIVVYAIAFLRLECIPSTVTTGDESVSA